MTVCKGGFRECFQGWVVELVECEHVDLRVSFRLALAVCVCVLCCVFVRVAWTRARR